jgi:hypothetical protein
MRHLFFPSSENSEFALFADGTGFVVYHFVVRMARQLFSKDRRL